MTLTMARLTPDSFLPSGALPDPNEPTLSYASLAVHPSSVISPPALPRSAAQLSPIDVRRQLGQHSAASSAQSDQHRHLSPGRSPPAASDPRSASLSPTYHFQQPSPYPPSGLGITSPGIASVTESPEHTGQHLRRVLLQNRRLLENWEAERTHLEANRARAEEIYKEERAIMDEDRLLWAERETRYMAKIGELERENATLRDAVAKFSARGSQDSAVAGVSDSGLASISRPAPVRSVSDSVSPGTISVLGLGHTMPESRPFEPLDPRMQGTSPQTQSPGDGPSCDKRIPPIDIQEVHPDLEGIPLNPTAVKKPTFTDGKPPSPPPSGANPTGSNSDEDSPGSRRTSPKELTKETMQAPEASRLIMHAGHTPNHSMSTFDTAASTIATNTADSSGASTPTHVLDPTHQHYGNLEDPEALLKPSDDDHELSGPLSLRNQQAFDEIFLGKVADKLMDSIRSDDATPTVLKNDADEAEAAPAEPQAAAPAADGASDPVDDDSKASPPAAEAGEVPLRFKKSSNFGAPLGSMWSF